MTGLDVAYYAVFFSAGLVGLVAGLRKGKKKSWKAVAVFSGLLWATALALLFARY